MSRRIRAAFILILGVWALTGGCREEMVGAPCVPETDKGEYNSDLQGTTYAIETRSVQCETKVCVTRTEKLSDTQLKYSFCSCRCRDLDGHTYQSDPDKYDYLCECPPDTYCESVLGDIEGAPEKITGSYCIPSCIYSPCDPGKTCTPSSDSEEPWIWTCKE